MLATRRDKQPRAKILISISAIFNQLPCLGVGYSRNWWWIIRSVSANLIRDRFCIMVQSRQATFSWKEAPCSCGCTSATRRDW